MSKFLGLKKLTKEDFKLGDEIVIGGEVYVKKQKPLSESKISFIWGDSDYDVGIVRAIEKEHGIGE